MPPIAVSTPPPSSGRSGAEVALEYFPDTLLSSPADLNATYFESGHFILDRQQQQKAALLALSGESSGASGGKGATMAGNEFTRKAANSRGGRALERLLRRRGDDEGAAAAADAVMEGVGGAPALPSTLKSSPSDGSRSLLRRVISRTNLRRPLQPSSLRAAAAAVATATAASTADDMEVAGEVSEEVIAATAAATAASATDNKEVADAFSETITAAAAAEDSAL